MPLVPVLAVSSAVVGLLLRTPDRFARRLLSLAVIGSAASVLMLPDLREYLAAHSRSSSPAGASMVSLVELNVWDANRDTARTVAWLRSARADVIVLAEARDGFTKELQRALPDYPTVVTCSTRPFCGVVIFSRFPGRLLDGGAWVSSGFQHRAAVDPGMAYATVELDIPGSDGRNRRVPVVAVHLDRKGLSGVTTQQVGVLTRLIGEAAGRSANDLILAGDFNTGPWSPQLRQLDRSIGATRLSAFAPSWPAGWRVLNIPIPPFLAIDHVYLGCRWRLQEFRVEREAGSDHRPLLARFAMQPQGTAGCLDDSQGGDKDRKPGGDGVPAGRGHG